MTETIPEFCPNCGKKTSANTVFCSFCGKTLTLERNSADTNIQSSEIDIFSFGPSGVMICLARPSAFAKARVNIKVFLTNKRIYGLNKFIRTKLYLELPIESILSLEACSYSRFKGVLIHHKLGSEIKEIAIMGDKNNYGNVGHLVELLTKMTATKT